MAIDFSNAISGAGIQMESQAQNLFGQAVDQFSYQSLSSQSILGGLGGSSTRGPDVYGEWNPTDYAVDLITYQPKHRWMFRVLFEMEPSFSNLIKNRKDVFQYVIKHIDRPKITFDYEEVNYYNYRTKVLKQIHHDPLGMTFIDDIQDEAHSFFRTYMMSYSPIMRSWNSGQSLDQLEKAGFNFTDHNGTSTDSAIRGVLADGKINPIKSITLIQYFGHASASNTFRFINPRIVSFSYDEAHHEGGDNGNHITMQFDYDAMVIEKAENANGASPYAVPGQDMYSAVENSGIDTSDGYFDGSSAGLFGTFANGLMGRASSVLGGATSNLLGSALGGVTNPLLSGASRNVVFAATQGVTNTARNTLFGVTGGMR